MKKMIYLFWGSIQKMKCSRRCSRGRFTAATRHSWLEKQQRKTPMILSRALSFVALAVVANVASAACPGLCSGNGYCGPDEVCTCFPGWGMDGEFPYSSRAWSFLCLLL